MSGRRAPAPLAYSRLASPLHAASAPVAAAYGAALVIAALIARSPITLAALLVAVLAAAVGAGVAGGLLRAARAVAIPIVLLTVLVNVLVSRAGITVFARLGDWGVLGQVNLTVEAVVYGLVFALRLLILMLGCLLVVRTANPDELLFSLRRVAPRSALTAALATRMIPLLAQDSLRLAEAQRCRPDGGARGLRGRVAILTATVAGALERSLDVAAVLEMRGYGSPAPRRAPRHSRSRSRHDLAFAAAAVALLGVSVLAAVSRAAPFDAYPLVALPVGGAALAVSASLVAIAVLPFLDRRGIEP